MTSNVKFTDSKGHFNVFVKPSKESTRLQCFLDNLSISIHICGNKTFTALGSNSVKSERLWQFYFWLLGNTVIVTIAVAAATGTAVIIAIIMIVIWLSYRSELEYQEMVHLCCLVVISLCAMHSRAITHLDLKPENGIV